MGEKWEEGCNLLTEVKFVFGDLTAFQETDKRE